MKGQRRNTYLSTVRKARREAARPVKPAVNPNWIVGGLDSNYPGDDLGTACCTHTEKAHFVAVGDVPAYCQACGYNASTADEATAAYHEYVAVAVQA